MTCVVIHTPLPVPFSLYWFVQSRPYCAGRGTEYRYVASGLEYFKREE